MSDVQDRSSCKKWFYSDIVKDHFFNPRNFLRTKEEAESYKADGVGQVGSPACGDMMKMWIRVKDDRIVECKWQTFGCCSAIASTSMLSVMVTENNGMKIEDALKIKPKDIVERLNGLPERKFHCSVLGDQALRAAISNYFSKKENNKMEKITKDMTIGNVVVKNPKAARILMSHGLHCIGCHVAANESLEQGCKAHGLSDEDIEKIVDEINKLEQSDEEE